MNKKRILGFILVFVLFLSYLLTIKTDAACPICSNDHDLSGKGPIEIWVYNMSCTIYGGEIISSETEEVLRFDTSSPKFSTLWNRGKELYNMFALLGKLLVCVYVMYDLMTKASGDNLTAESFFLAFVRLCVGIIIITSGYDLITYGIQICSGIFEKVNLDASWMSGASSENPFRDSCPFGRVTNNMASSDYDMFNAMVEASGIFIPWLLLLFAGLLITITCWARVLDIMLRVIFAPIGMADIINDGMRSGGWRYFKKLLASTFQASVITVAIKSYGLVMEVIAGMNGLAAWGLAIIMSFVLIGVIFKSSSIADDIIL